MTEYLPPDNSPKTLHIGIRQGSNHHDENGLIYDPRKISTNIGATSQDFYRRLYTGADVTTLQLKTRQTPGELVRVLEEEVGITWSTIMEEDAAPFKASKEQAARIIEEIQNNPHHYYESDDFHHRKAI